MSFFTSCLSGDVTPANTEYVWGDSPKQQIHSGFLFGGSEGDGKQWFYEWNDDFKQ